MKSVFMIINIVVLLLFTNITIAKEYEEGKSNEVRIGLVTSGIKIESENIIEYIINEIDIFYDQKINFTFSYYSTEKEAISALSQHKVHMVPVITPNNRNKEKSSNKESFIYSQPLYSKDIYAFSNGQLYSNIDVLSKEIIIENDCYIIEYITDYLVSYKLNDEANNFTIVKDMGELLSSTELNNEQVIISSKVEYQLLNKRKIGYLGEVAFAINSEHAALLEIIDRYLEGNNITKKISNYINKRNFNIEKKQLLLSLSEPTRNILEKKKINLLLDSDYAPYSYWSDFSQKHNGTIADVVNSINYKYNKVISIIEEKGIEQNWSKIISEFSLFTDYNDENVNMVLVSGLRLLKTQSNLYFSMPIEPIEIAIFKNAKKKFSNELRVGVIESDLGEYAANDLLKVNKDKNYSIKKYSTANMLKKAYFRGQIDAVIHNSQYIEIFFGNDYRVLVQDYLYFASSDIDVIKAMDELLIITGGNIPTKNINSQDKVLASSRLDSLLVEENIRLRERSYLYFLLIFFLFTSVSFLLFFYNKSKKASIYDQLTELKNRRGLYRDKNDINKTHGSCALIDIDNFKYFNDNHGHQYGDQILNNFAINLERIFPKGHSYRLSGDEFFVYVPNLSIDAMADYINKLLSACFNQLIYSYSFSAGIYYKEKNDSEWLEKSDTAMYVSKSKGKKGLSYFDEKIARDFNRLKYIETHLVKAISKKSFSIHLQPQVEVKSGKIVGFESLARWEVSEFGNISPVEFIPVAEQQGVVSDLDLLIAEKTILATKYLINKNLISNSFCVSFNFSIETLLNLEVIEKLKLFIIENEIASHYFQIELTETQLISDKEQVLHILNDLKLFGFSIALDDFSTGNSSIIHLASLPFDTVKLDRELLLLTCNQGCEYNQHFQSVISMIKNFNLKIVAEGVENERARELVIENGIDIIQGYYYYKPMPFNKLISILLNQK